MEDNRLLRRIIMRQVYFATISERRSAANVNLRLFQNLNFIGLLIHLLFIVKRERIGKNALDNL